MNGRHCWYIEEGAGGECEVGCVRWPEKDGCAFLTKPCPWHKSDGETCAYDAEEGIRG